MAQTRMADGCRNVVTGALVATGGGVGASYGGAHANNTNNPASNSTQAFVDALSGGPLPVYVPSGTYYVTGPIVIHAPGCMFGEPSAPPTIILKAGSMTSGATPLFTIQPASSVNNPFQVDFLSINVTVQTNNLGCSDVMYWAVAQRNSLRDCIFIRQDGGGRCLRVGGGGGGGTINFVTCTGATYALTVQDTS